MDAINGQRSVFQRFNYCMHSADEKYSKADNTFIALDEMKSEHFLHLRRSINAIANNLQNRIRL